MSKECDGNMLFNIKSLILPLDSITEFGDECYAHLRCWKDKSFISEAENEE